MHRQSLFPLGRTQVLTLTGALLLTAGCARIGPPHGTEPVVRVMLVTAYCPCGECCGWRRTCLGTPVYSSGPKRGERKEIGVTSTGAAARRGTIAADPARYPYGTIMYIEGYGRGVVEDCGGAIKGERLDLFFESHREAVQWGRKRLPVKIWFVPSRRGEAWPESDLRMNADVPPAPIPGMDDFVQRFVRDNQAGPVTATTARAPNEMGI
jgi:3D (Asp-Asp-Asp) domain-containing protein